MFQQGFRTVPVFRGVHFRVTSPRPERLKPNRFAVGDIGPEKTSILVGTWNNGKLKKEYRRKNKLTA